MDISINGNSNDTIYGRGDICLKLNPFDSYKLFTLYENWKSDDRKPLDLSGEQNLYLIFKSKNKEIRIPEYKNIGGYTIDKTNGQVLFKINQKNAIDILSMDTKTFYITRMYETKGLISDEEVVYTGQWKDETSNSKEDLTTQIKNLTSVLEERTNSIKELQASNAQLIEQNVKFAAELEDSKSKNELMEKEIDVLIEQNNELKSGAEYDGTYVGKADYNTIIESKKYTEDQMQKVIEELEQKGWK